MIIDYFLLHGYVLWISWTIFSLIMITSGRYNKGNIWKSRMKIHLVLGFLILILTFIFCNILPSYKKGSTSRFHTNVGGAVLYAVMPVVFIGLLSRNLLNNCKWYTRLGLRLKKLHKLLSYLIITVGNIAIITGIYSYRTSPNSLYPSDFPYEWLNLSISLFIYLVAEIIYNLKFNKEDSYLPKIKLNMQM